MRRYIIPATVISSLILIVASWLYINSFQKVTITFNRSHGTITLEGSTLKEPLTVVSEQEMKLKKGSYKLITSGTNVKQTTEDLQVGGEPIEKNIYIPLEDAYLSKQLSKEQEVITRTIAEHYPRLQTFYTINPGKLYGRGEWYGTTLTYKGSDSDNRDTLRLLLKKENKQWLLVTTPPQQLLSTKLLPDVPSYILRDINQPAYLPGTANSPAIQPE